MPHILIRRNLNGREKLLFLKEKKPQLFQKGDLPSGSPTGDRALKSVGRGKAQRLDPVSSAANISQTSAGSVQSSDCTGPRLSVKMLPSPFQVPVQLLVSLLFFF